MKMTDEGQRVTFDLTYREAEKLLTEIWCISQTEPHSELPTISKISEHLDEYVNT